MDMTPTCCSLSTYTGSHLENTETQNMKLFFEDSKEGGDLSKAAHVYQIKRLKICIRNSKLVTLWLLNLSI